MSRLRKEAAYVIKSDVAEHVAGRSTRSPARHECRSHVSIPLTQNDAAHQRPLVSVREHVQAGRPQPSLLAERRKRADRLIGGIRGKPMRKPDPTSSTSSVTSTDEPVKGSLPPTPPMPPQELRLFGGGATDHYTALRLPMFSAEAVLVAALNRFNIRTRALLLCRTEIEPFSSPDAPQEVA